MSEPRVETAPRAPIVSNLHMGVLAILRMVIGWLFLYEGLVKLRGDWSSAAYLETARWMFADTFQAIAADPTALAIVDFANVWGLILVGTGLMLGCFTRAAAVSGILLLSLYYLAHPPIRSLGFVGPQEGSYLWVTKNVVVVFGLLVVAIVPTGKYFGLDRLISWWLRRTPSEESPAGDLTLAAATSSGSVSLERRDVLKSLAGLPILGGFVVTFLKRHGWPSHEEENLKGQVDAVTSATIKTFDFSSLKDLKGTMPTAPIAGKAFSRVILGGNLIGGWAHARDLVYVSKLVKAYHHDDKVFETLYLAEKCGVNALLTNPMLCPVINAYWKRKIGNIQFISDCGAKDGPELLEKVQLSIDRGAASCYVQGETADRLVAAGDLDSIAKALDITRAAGLPAGIGAHKIETIKACVERGFQPDFWMKTLHHHDYWSAKPEEWRDNMFCYNPEETISFMKNLPQPWIAFKTLAAGAIQPAQGFRYALENGADFLCVGMYDFQIVDDCNIALDLLASDLMAKRERRPWPTTAEPGPTVGVKPAGVKPAGVKVERA